MSLEPIFMPTDHTRPEITVRPEAQPDAPREAMQPRKAFQKATLGDGKSFSGGDFIDLINPLQHIPVIGQAYRAITGDTISKEANILGGTLYGGPVGLIASAVSAIIEHEAQGAQALAAGEAKRAKQELASVSVQNKPLEMAQMMPRPMITPTFSPPPPAPAKAADDLLGDEPYVIEQAYDRPVSANPAQVPADAIAPAAAPLPEELQKHDAILELFGSGLSSAADHYRKQQQLDWAHAAQKQLTA